MIREAELADTLVDKQEPNSSAFILEALEDAERAFQNYMTLCRTVDHAYSLSTATATMDMSDEEFALFWASMEILKPAIYAKPPKPIASPRFKDGGPVEKTTAELIERCLESTFDRGDIDGVMLGARDDLALTNRGVAWVMYETDEKGGGQRVCIEHLDRSDFLHEPARKWAEVGWVARRAWMTRKQMQKRFDKLDLDVLSGAQFHSRKEKDDYGHTDNSEKAGVWEVWSKVDNKVYWVTEGIDEILDEDEPHLNLRNFFPCPKPAYGTLQRRSLIPVPDYKRYKYHLDQINELTSRIYVLLEKVKLKVLVPGGGDIGNAVQTALDSSDDSIVISVPAMALQAGATNGLMLTLPLQEVATTIQGLIEARGQLIEDFYQLSGISDIMRGATEAEETLGAQQLKSQYGSVRVRDKIDELQRLARDIAQISAEILAQNFSQKTLLDLSRMTIPTKSEVKRKLDEARDACKEALEKLEDDLKENAGKPGPDGKPVDPQMVEQAFKEKQQEIIAQFQPVIRELSSAVVIEDVMEMLRDTKSRNLMIDIETDSTILTDEMAEKQSRGEFLNAFSSASQAVAALMQAGEAGAKLAGGILKFSLQPYRANRELDALIDEFVDNAGNMMPQDGANAEQQALVQAQNKLAEAEMAKAQAQTMKVQADAQGKMQDLQLRAAEAQAKAQAEQQRLVLELEKSRATIAETEARIEKIFAEIQKLGIDSTNQTRQQDREDVKTVADIQMRQTDQALNAQDRQRQAVESDRNAQLSERQQSFSEQQGERAEQRADRQQTFAERQAEREPAE
jgi:hypothetical protein